MQLHLMKNGLCMVLNRNKQLRNTFLSQGVHFSFLVSMNCFNMVEPFVLSKLYLRILVLSISIIRIQKVFMNQIHQQKEGISNWKSCNTTL